MIPLILPVPLWYLHIRSLVDKLCWHLAKSSLMTYYLLVLQKSKTPLEFGKGGFHSSKTYGKNCIEEGYGVFDNLFVDKQTLPKSRLFLDDLPDVEDALDEKFYLYFLWHHWEWEGRKVMHLEIVVVAIQRNFALSADVLMLDAVFIIKLSTKPMELRFT